MSDTLLASLVELITEDNEGLFYHKETGKMYRLKEIHMTRERGDGFGSRSITFKGKQRQATHIAFYLVMGRWPEDLIDHKDGDGLNSKWDNLREATFAQNMYNKSDTGRWVNTEEELARGVSKIDNKYRVQLNNITIGYYYDREEANAIANEIRQKLHGEFSYENSRSTE